MRSERIRRRLIGFILIVTAALGAAHAGGCNSASLTDSGPCVGSGCTCEADPTQPRCKGYNERPDGDIIDTRDARGAEDAPVEASDAASDAPDDGGDAAD